MDGSVDRLLAMSSFFATAPFSPPLPHALSPSLPPLSHPPLQTRVARFHNVYGPYGTWKGGREKAPAAFCRKALAAKGEVEMWGDGKQTRSFTFIDDCVEGILRITKSDFSEPLNLGSDEMISMNDMMAMAMGFDSMKLGIKHIPGPEGVRGRKCVEAPSLWGYCGP